MVDILYTFKGVTTVDILKIMVDMFIYWMVDILSRYNSIDISFIY